MSDNALAPYLHDSRWSKTGFIDYLTARRSRTIYYNDGPEEMTEEQLNYRWRAERGYQVRVYEQSNGLVGAREQ